MKNLFLKFGIALLTLGAVSSTSFAGVSAFNGTVSFIGTDWNYSRFLVGLNGTTGNCPFGQFSVEGTNPNYKETVATIMLAYALKKTVSLDVDGSCPNNRANVIGLYLNQ